MENFNNQVEVATETEEKPTEVTGAENIPETVLYDARATQRHTFQIEDVEMLITHICTPFDDLLAEYDAQREINVATENKKSALTTDSATADEWLFNRICESVEGYDDDAPVPENFLDLIELDEKQETVKALLSVKKYQPDDAPTVKKRSWRKPAFERDGEIRLISLFDGREVLTTVFFKPKDHRMLGEYNRLRGKLWLNESKGFDETTIGIPSQMAAKGKLFDALVIRTEGYAGGIVPLHHKATAVALYFDKTLKKAEKK